MKVLSCFHVSVLVTLWIGCGSALITPDTIRNLTMATDEYRDWVLEMGDVDVDVDVGRGVERGVERQVVLGGGSVGKGDGDDGNEIEDTVAAALRMLCTDLLIELERPLTTTLTPSSPSSPSSERAECKDIKKEYHDFLASTAKFLYAVQERQMAWRWGNESAVYDGVAWMQGLWASRRRNSQNRSFIEQQMSMYAETGCFGKSKEVLRRDVEVVEYLNDLMDLFE